MNKPAIAFLTVMVSLASGVPAGIIDERRITGGLVVVVGYDQSVCDEMIKAVDNGPFVVQFLDSDPGKIDAARQYIVKNGSYGKVTANVWAKKRLPYTDNLVNQLVFLKNTQHQIPDKEIMRVVTPRGLAVFKGARIARGVTEDIDDWTHYLHGADGNAVARDKRIHNPKRFQ